MEIYEDSDQWGKIWRHLKSFDRQYDFRIRHVTHLIWNVLAGSLMVLHAI